MLLKCQWRYVSEMEDIMAITERRGPPSLGCCRSNDTSDADGLPPSGRGKARIHRYLRCHKLRSCRKAYVSDIAEDNLSFTFSLRCSFLFIPFNGILFKKKTNIIRDFLAHYAPVFITYNLRRQLADFLWSAFFSVTSKARMNQWLSESVNQFQKHKCRRWRPPQKKRII